VKRCKAKGCTTRFHAPGFIVWCSPECGASIAQDRLAKKRAKEAKEDRKQTKVKLADLKPLSHWAGLTQDAFNAYIRARDAHLPCISCGRDNESKVNAGHFLSVGSHPELRFDESNVHKQCEYCNGYKGGNAVFYRAGLIQRIGLAEVERLEGPHEAKKYTREQLAEMRATYRQKAKELMK